jgi:hypothetical protein
LISRTGILKNYKTLFNGDFFKVKPLENAPKISSEDVQLLLDNFNNIDLWREKFPPNSYEFKGADFGIGTHIVTVEAANSTGCMGYDSIAITVQTPTGLKDQNVQFSLNIYPNPSNGNVTMEIEGLSSEKIMNVEVSTAVPIIYTLETKTLKLIDKKVLEI